jgi:hypothetical protein
MRIVRLPRQKLTADPARDDAPCETPRELVDEQIRRILASDVFANSDRLRRLLEFVGYETLSGRRELLKEYNLGVGVFDRGASYDPRTDPIVRVEAGRLRTRLAKYYATVGEEDPLIIDLPKGGYCISVQPRRAANPAEAVHAAPPHRALDRKTIALAAVAAVACCLLGYSLYLRQRLAKPAPALPGEAAAFWAPFLSPGAETVIVFGSPMFFESPQKRVYVRPYDINDPAAVRDNPELQGLEKVLGGLTEPQYTYTQTGDALALHRLGMFFSRYGKNAEAIPANLANWESIREKNIVFVGSVRMMPFLRRLPVQLDFEVQPDKYVLNRNPRPGEERVYSTSSHTDLMSYAIIATSPGLRPGREILIFTSHGSAGTNAGVEYLTELDTLRELTARVQPKRGVRQDYQVLLRVLADKDQAFKSEYITHHATQRPATPGN